MRFKEGDLARVVVSFTSSHIGNIVEIFSVGRFFSGQMVRQPGGDGFMIYDADYILNEIWPDGNFSTCDDWQLQPIDPPAEPASLTRQSENKEVV